MKLFSRDSALSRVMMPSGLLLMFGSTALFASPVLAAADPDTLVVAVGAEPETMLPRNACSTSADFVTDTVYERLTQLQPDGTVGGWLAESFSQLDDTTWQFKLHQGITFSDGEPLNADAIVRLVAYYTDKANPSQCLSGFATLDSAQKVDDYTVNLKTNAPDLTFPARMLQMYVVAPDFATKTPDDQAAITAVGTGPYVMTEWAKGDHITLKARPDYWGNPKPSFGTVRIVGRSEEAVRSAMVQSGEADMAINISQELAAALPKAVTQHTTESVLLRINTDQQFLKDPRVREAINISIDRATIMQALYPGVTSDLNGQAVRPSALGYNPDLKPYPYDPDKAAQLVKEAGAEGQNVNIVIRTDIIPHVMELAEALQSQIGQSGLKVTLQPMEAAAWRTLLWATQPGQERSDMLIASASNIQFDSSRVLGLYFGDGQYSHTQFPDLIQAIHHAGTQKGDERVTEYRAIWKEIYDNYWFVPLFGLDFIHGLSARVDWTPRPDGFLYFNTVTKAN